MHIISKFHDFYDSAAKYGKDMTVVYDRKEMEFDLRNRTAPKLITDLSNKIRDVVQPTDARSQFSSEWYIRSFGEYDLRNEVGDQFTMEKIYIVFCGSVHPGYRIRVSRRKLASPPSFIEYFYSATALFKFFEKEGVNVDCKRSSWDKVTYRDRIEQVLSPKPNDGLKDWLIENKVSVAVIDGHYVIVNPQLDKYQFYKAYDCVTAYQELDMWISGTLAYPQNVVIEIEDKYKIMEHGFDKWSFRKMPEKKRA